MPCAPSKAGLAYAHAVRISPRYPEAYKNLGNLLKSRDHWRRAAVRAYRVALELNPTSREVFLNLGETLQWLGEGRTANVTYALAVERGVWAHAQQRPSMCADTLPFIITPCSSIPPPNPIAQIRAWDRGATVVADAPIAVDFAPPRSLRDHTR